ncbi:MAG: ISNCY family transposase [Gammaproteobacteria bacterium]
MFFTQSPSFLAYQRDMAAHKGQSNAHTLFGLSQIPSDNQIRTLLDPVPPELLGPVFDHGLSTLAQTHQLSAFRSWQQRLLVVLDGTQYFTSQKISCPQCSRQTHSNGTTTYSHRMLTPVIVAPHQNKVIPLPPEFIVPQDGHAKQDCENAAAKRWLHNYAATYRAHNLTILGDDLYATQPICEVLIEERLPFLLVCKPDSHPTLYAQLAQRELGKELHEVTHFVHSASGMTRATYRYASQLPLRASADTLYVNWCELTLASAAGTQLYHNAFMTQAPLTAKTVVPIVQAGRTRWKVENENNNTLKTQGYHLEHNFGHGTQHLAALLATFNLLAFLFHTLLDLRDAQYHHLRLMLVSRKTFFDDLRALTRYLCFASWAHLLAFMLQGLHVQLPLNSS